MASRNARNVANDWFNPKSMAVGAGLLFGVMIVPQVRTGIVKVVNRISSVFGL